MRISDWSSGVCSSDLVADQSTDQLHDLVLVFAHEQFERALVTRLRADNELFVGNVIAHALMRFSRGRKTLHSQPRNSSKTRFRSGQRRTQTLAYRQRRARIAQSPPLYPPRFPNAP